MNGVFDDRRYLIPFRSTLLPQIFTDVLVIGSGAAGLSAAAIAAERGADVIVLAKADADISNTAWAQGGIAIPLNDDADFESHVHDTHVAGDGLCDDDAVRHIIAQGPAAGEALRNAGMRFDLGEDGDPAMCREGGHAVARILHAGGDETGKRMAEALISDARRKPSVRIFERCFALDLITASDEVGSPVMGAITHHPKFGLQMIWARTTILASGGAGQVYRETTNPRAATADGIAMAYRAGARLADMAFVQFHPTTLYLPGANRTLISEAVRGEGAHLVDSSGVRFMPAIHELAELAPRDVVSRAIVRQMTKRAGEGVFLDARHVPDFATRFPSIHAQLARFELDPAKDLVPVHPAAHYIVGGVRAGCDGETGVPGLLAVGEVACTGLHGANRLASNSLLEAVVCGIAAGERAAETAARAPGPIAPIPVISNIPPSDHGELDLSDVRSSLRSAMWRNVGIERTGSKLDDAVEMFDFWGRYTLDKVFDEPMGWETQNMLLVGAMIARSAAWRAESRGTHWRDDEPEPKAEFLMHDVWQRGCAEPAVEPIDSPVRTEA